MKTLVLTTLLIAQFLLPGSSFATETSAPAKRSMCIPIMNELSKEHGTLNKEKFKQLLSRGLYGEIDYIVQHVIDVLGRSHSQKMPVSRRGLWRYLWNLHLLPYAFEGKKIADIAAGKSPFTTLINEVYASEGTVAVAIDYGADREKNEHDRFVKGDAFQLSFADHTFDLTVSSWFLNNIWLNYREVDGVKKRELHLAIDEMIRITKPGGEVRFIRTFLEIGDIGNLVTYLQNHPRVAHVKTFPAGLLNGAVVVELKP